MWEKIYRRKDIKYVKAASDMVNRIYNILYTAIKTIYPKYYPKEVAAFFCKPHSKEHILAGISYRNMGVLECDNSIVGMGCFDGNHITGYMCCLLIKIKVMNRIL